MDWGTKFAIGVVVLFVMALPFIVGDMVYQRRINNCASSTCTSDAWNDYLTLLVTFGAVWTAVVILIVVRNVADHV